MSDLRLRISIIEKNERGQEVELVRKVIQFKPQTTAYDACAHIRQRLTEIKGLGIPGQYGLFLADEDPKKGVWLDPAKTLEHYLLRENDSLEYRKIFRLLKVKMLDGAVKSVMVDDSQTVSTLMAVVCTKIGLTNHDEYSLVWDKPEEEQGQVHQNRFGTLGGTMTLRRTKIKEGEKEIDPKMENLKRQLNTEDGVNWVDHSKTLREQGIVETDVLLLKRKYFFSDANIDSTDPVQLNLLYEQAREGVLDGTHPVPEAEAIQFAALQCQVQFGDHKDSHKIGMLDLKEFLPQSYVKASKIEKKIFSQHKEFMGVSEVDAKLKYVKLARGLPTFGVHFFLVKEKMKGKNRLVPRLLGVTKDSVLRLDENSKQILKTWPLTTVRRWAASPNVFTLDFGDYQDQYYSVQTTEGEQISQLIAGYIDIILKRRARKERFGDDGNEEEAMEEDLVTPGRAITMVGLPGANYKKVEASNLAKPGVLRNPNANGSAEYRDNRMDALHAGQYPRGDSGSSINGARHPEELSLSGPQRALISTISNGQKSISEAESMLTEKAQLPMLGNDPASVRWRERQKNTSKQSVHSQVSAMNAATAQMVTLTGQGEETDHNAVGAAVNTISSNLPEMAKGVKMLAALMDDEGANGDDLMHAAKQLCVAFSDLLAATEPESKEPRQTMLSAASQVGSASHRVLYTIGEEEVVDKERQDILLGRAKEVANATAALVLKAKNVASKCPDQHTQNRVIGAATQCALATSQIVACAKVVAPTISDPLCQEQLVEAAREVAKSVEGCVSTSREVSRDEASLRELGLSAQNVTRALNELLNHVKDGHQDRIPDIMEQIMVASGELISSYDSGEMVMQARILAQSTAQLIQAIKGEAETQSDTDLQKRLMSAAKELAEATAKMVEAAKLCAGQLNDRNSQDALKRAAEHLRNTSHNAVGTTIKRKIIKRLENASKHAAATATQCIAASQTAEKYNQNSVMQDELLDNCKVVAEVIPRLIEGVKSSMQNPDSALAQLNLITACEQFLEPSRRLTDAARSALPTINDQAASLQLSNSTKQVDNAAKELQSCIYKAHQLGGSLQIEAAADLIESYQSELEEFRAAANALQLKPLPGETPQSAALLLNTTSKSVGLAVVQLLTASSEGNEDYTSNAARQTANALKEFSVAVRGVAATSNNRDLQNLIIDSAQLVCSKSARLVLEAQRTMVSPSNRTARESLSDAGKDVSRALSHTIDCLPGQSDVLDSINSIENMSRRIDMGDFPQTGRPYGELQTALGGAVVQLNQATNDVVQTAPIPDQLATSSRQFSQALGQMMDYSMDIAGQTSFEETRTEMVSTMKSVTITSSELLSTAKIVSLDPLHAQSRNNLTQAARNLTKTMNDLINVYTSAAPGQTECDNAIRAIQSSRHVLQNSSQPTSDLTYFESLDSVMDKSKVFGDGMKGIVKHAKPSQHEEFCDSVRRVSDAICGLIEAAAQAAYLVGIADPSSVAGRKGLVNHSQFYQASQAIKNASVILRKPRSSQQEILSAANIIANSTSLLCNSCKAASANTDNQGAKRQFVQSIRLVADATATLVKEIKELDRNDTEEQRTVIGNSTGPLIDAVDTLCQFANSPDYSPVPGKISDAGRRAQEPILESGYFIIDGSCSMIQAAKSLAINPQDPPMWETLSKSSKAVSDAIKNLVSAIRDLAPGQRECDDAIEKLTHNIRELDQASLAAINQNLTPKKDIDIKQLTEQMENAAQQIARRLPEVRETAKKEVEVLGHAISSMISFFNPLVNNAIGCASYMVNSKQQVQVLDQTKNVAECAQQLMYAVKQSGGNPKATQIHGDIDESADATGVAINELVGTIAKLAPNLGIVSRNVKCITEAIFTVNDYRSGSHGEENHDQVDSFVNYYSQMMMCTKDIARTAQDIVIKSTNEPEQLGPLSDQLSTCYTRLAYDAKSARFGTGSVELGQRLWTTVEDLGQATILLVKSTGFCHATPNNSFALRDLSENARNVGEKCTHVLSALNAANSGTFALENAANTVSGIIGDLDTTILFATAGTLNPDEHDEAFSEHRENILKTARALVEDTKTLVAGAASSQEQLAVAAQNAVITIVKLSEDVKAGATSLSSPNREAQVMLINAVKDVASALSDLMQSTKAASGKNIHDPAMHQLKDSAKIMVTNVTSLLKTVKAVEDEHTRGTRALESSIEAIAQEIRSFESSEQPRTKCEPEDLIRATRPITIATGKAVSAGKSLKQEDIIVAANMGRKAISDMLATCKGAAQGSNKAEARNLAIVAGHDAAVQYRELLQIVMQNLLRPSPEAKNQLGNISRKIAQCVTELAAAAEQLKDDDWVDPSDPSFIAENELLNAAKSIENAAKKLAALKPRTEVKGREINPEMNFDELIIDAAKSIAAATAALIKAASEAQRELVSQGKIQKVSSIHSEDGQWSEGLVSAARLVAAATQNLCEAANALVKGHSSEEKLIGAAQQVAGLTAKLLLACKVKADPDSLSMKRLEAASNAVRKASESLVKAAQQAINQVEETHNIDLNKSAVNSVVEEINARSEVLRKERELEMARGRLEKLHQRKYQTDSETEQSGYESSGYDESFFRKNQLGSSVNKSGRSGFQQQNIQQQQQQQHRQTESSEQQSTIESGPTFHESMERFRSATGSGSGTESDGGRIASSSSRQQKYSSQTVTQSSSSIQRTALTRSVEEQRTMITRNSQKSYHIE